MEVGLSSRDSKVLWIKFDKFKKILSPGWKMVVNIDVPIFFFFFYHFTFRNIWWNKTIYIYLVPHFSLLKSISCLQVTYPVEIYWLQNWHARKLDSVQVFCFWRQNTFKRYFVLWERSLNGRYDLSQRNITLNQCRIEWRERAGKWKAPRKSFPRVLVSFPRQPTSAGRTVLRSWQQYAPVLTRATKHEELILMVSSL